MPIPIPAIQWPAHLAEKGPAEDPAVLLSGQARIGGVSFKVMALRMRDGMRMPDYRPDVSGTLYEDAMEAMVADIEDLVDSMEPELIAVGGASYLLWMVPSARA